jgi:hypothetical protein
VSAGPFLHLQNERDGHCCQGSVRCSVVQSAPPPLAVEEDEGGDLGGVREDALTQRGVVAATGDAQGARQLSLKTSLGERYLGQTKRARRRGARRSGLRVVVSGSEYAVLDWVVVSGVLVGAEEAATTGSDDPLL